MIIINTSEEWYTFSQASRLIGKNRNYFSNRYKLSPELFTSKGFKIEANIKMLNQHGINYILNSIKKAVGHVNNVCIYMACNLNHYFKLHDRNVLCYNKYK